MSMAVKHAMNKRKMAKGGEAKRGEEKSQPGHSETGHEKGIHTNAAVSHRGTEKSMAGIGARNYKASGWDRSKKFAVDEHKKVISEMHEMKSKDRTNLAEGGEVTDPQPSKADDMASSMRKAFHFAEGGDVDCMACQGGACMEHGGLVDRIMKKRGAVEEAPNDFDVLDLEPAPEADYPGSNEHGDAEVEEDERDLVARIMRSRAKKDRMPRTA